MASGFETALIQDRYHQAIEAWQKKHFPELELLQKNWAKYFGAQTPFQLCAKVSKLKNEAIEYGQNVGLPKIQQAGEMVGNMFYSARDIIRAQCSTELGSIQQHRLTLESSLSDETKYAILRIMAEELRHAYQMFWVFDHDQSWKKPGHSDIAQETMDELLAMETGTHVLDAFNIEFITFLDNAMFATVIDLVGKYQLEMQKVCSYAPMARSMMPMLSEEGFHMASGRNIVKEVALRAVEGVGDYSVQDIQKSLQQWYPRGVEMFGNEAGGFTAVQFGFKNKANGQAQAEYIEEVRGIFEDINVAMALKKLNITSREEARALVRDIETNGGPVRGIQYADLLHVPSSKFFRRRGPEDVIYKPYDIKGEIMMSEGRPLTSAKYFDYLKTILPAHYLKTSDFDKYQSKYRERENAPQLNAGFLI